MGSKKGVPRGKYKNKLVKSENVSCESCGKKYKRKPALLQHILSKHLGFCTVCPVCGNSFSSVSTCHRHLRDVHNVRSVISELNLKPPKKVKITSDKSTRPTRPATKNELSFPGYKSFPNMANAISFEDNEIFGKHIVAKCDIETGKIVMVVDAFASIEYLSSVQEKCFECGKTKNADAFSCSHCIDVWFCSPKCSFSTAHQSKCNKIFNRHDSREVRLVTEMIKITFETTKDVNMLVDFSRGIMFGEKKSENCLPEYSRYGEILNLKCQVKNEHLSMAKRVRKILMALPDFKIIGSTNSTDFERIMFYMAYRHLSTIQINAFTEEFNCKKGKLYLFSIYDILSRFNHSCSPNIKHTIYNDNKMRCKVVRPVKKGDQVSKI